MILPQSSRDKPNVVCVRSLVPKLKNSASRAISPAESAAAGNSIMVPTRYSTSTPFFLNTSAATRLTISFCKANSLTSPTSGIMTSGFASMPFFMQSFNYFEQLLEPVQLAAALPLGFHHRDLDHQLLALGQELVERRVKRAD